MLSFVIGLLFKLLTSILKKFRNLNIESQLAARSIQLLLPYIRWREFQSINADVVKKYRNEMNTLKDKIRNIEQKLDHYSNENSLTISSHIINHKTYKNNIIEKAIFTTHYNLKGDYVGHYSFSGRRKNMGETSEILVQISASEAISDVNKQLQFKAGGLGNKIFPSRCIDDTDMRKKIFKIMLQPPIKEENTLNYWYSFTWPNVGNDEINSDTINFKQYSEDMIPDITHKLHFPYKLIEKRIIEIVNGEPSLSGIDISEKVENQDFVYEYKINNRDLDGIIMYWRRDISN